MAVGSVIANVGEGIDVGLGLFVPKDGVGVALIVFVIKTEGVGVAVVVMDIIAGELVGIDVFLRIVVLEGIVVFVGVAVGVEVGIGV